MGILVRQYEEVMERQESMRRFRHHQRHFLRTVNGMLYEENLEHLGLEQDAICTVRDLLEKVVTDYAILPAKPNMEEVKRALTLLENHAVIQRIDGKFNQGSCKFAILPTVLAAVSSEKLNAVVAVLKKEEENEETEEDTSD